MTHGDTFQDQIRQLGKLIAQFEQLPDGPHKTACKEVVQLLMDVHGAGLERMMEIVFESAPDGPAIIDTLARDPTVSGLLLLYSLHPDDLETRVRKAIDHMRPRIRKLACSVDLVRIEAGAVQIQLTSTSHSCSSSARDLRAIVEDTVYEYAPDVASLEVLGLEEPSPVGFVSVETLLGQSLAGHNLAAASSSSHAGGDD